LLVSRLQFSSIAGGAGLVVGSATARRGGIRLDWERGTDRSLGERLNLLNPTQSGLLEVQGKSMSSGSLPCPYRRPIGWQICEIQEYHHIWS
jgi:hypothetical protein